MKATARFESSRYAGIPLVFMGVLILAMIVPFFWFVASQSGSTLLLAVFVGGPSALGLAVLIAGLLQCTGQIKLGPPKMVIETGDAEQRLDELERLKTGNLITSEEYAAKRQEILKDL